MIIHSRGARVLPALLLTLGLLLGGGFTGSTPALAFQPDQAGVFELDGNACANTATGTDWSSLFHPNNNCLASAANGGTGFNGSAGTPLASTFIDEPVATDTTYLTGGASKDPSDFNNWQLQTCTGTAPNLTGCSVQDKDQINQAFAALYTPTTGPAAGHQLMYFGDDRYTNNGDAFTGFWITKSPIGFNGTPGFACGTAICGQHQVGDLLISSNFIKGGATDEVRVYQWQPAAADGPLHLLADVTTRCGPTNTNDFCEITNSGGQAAPWTYQFKGVGTSATFPQATFFEGGIDLTAFAGPNACFSTFIAETRSSQSFTSTLSDVAMHSFPTCSANITLSPNSVNEVNHSHDFTATVSQTNAGNTTPVSGATVNWSIVSNTTTGGGFVTPPGNTCTTNASGQCSITVNSPTAGVIQVHASANVTIGGSTFQVQTDGQNGNSGDRTKRFVDARLTLTPLNATNDVAVHPLHTIYARVQSDDGLPANATGGDACTGWCDAPTGTTVNWGSLANNTAAAQFTNSTGSSSLGNTTTCSTQTQTVNSVSGNFCAVYLKSAAAGSVDVPANISISIGGVTLNRATDDNVSGDSAHANKTYVNAYITLSPLSATNSIGQPHTVTATVYQDDGLPSPSSISGADGCTGWCAAPAGTVVTLTLPSGQNGASANFIDSSGNSLGTSTTCTLTVSAGVSSCTARINSLSSGTSTIHATVTFNVGVAALGGPLSVTRATGDGLSQDSSDATKTYVSGTLSLIKTVAVGTLSGTNGYPNVCFNLSYDTLQAGDVHISPIASDTSSDPNTVYTYDSATDSEKECHQYSSSDTTAGTTSFTFTWHPLSKSHYVTHETVTSPWVAIADQHVFVDPTDPNNKNVTVGPFNDPLPTGSLQIEKTINGTVAPVNGDQFTFKYQYCAADSTCANPTPAIASAPSALVPGCDMVDGTAQPTNCSPKKNPITVSGLLEGYYKVTETAVPSAYSIDTSTNPQIVAVYAANDQQGAAHSIPLATINNIKLFRIIVVACDMNNNLVPSSVSLTPSGGGASQGPLTSVAHNGYGSFTDAQLCGIPGATFPSLSPGTYSLSVGPLG